MVEILGTVSFERGQIALKHVMLSTSVNNALVNLDLPDSCVTRQEITRQIDAATLLSDDIATKTCLALDSNG